MKYKKGTDEEADSFDDQSHTPDEVEDSSSEEVESTDEGEDISDEDYELELKKKSNSKGSKAKSDRSKFKIISYKANDKAESSQATPKAQSSQAKASRPNVIVGLASQYKNLATNCVEKFFGTRTAAEGSKSKGKRRVGGYESEKYSDAEDAAGTNHSDQKLVKRGITRLYKFRREYGKSGEIKIKHIGLKILSWKKVDKESRDKLWDEITKEADDKIKEGTLNLDDGTYAMTVVFGKEKGGYKLSNEMTKTKGMLSQLMNQLAVHGVQLNLSSQFPVASDVTPMAINNIDSSAYEVDGTQSSVVVRDKDTRIQKKSNGLVTSEKVTETMAFKCKLWHLKKSNIVVLGTIYKSVGNKMLHSQALLNDCYKVSIDSLLVDATCIPDVGNNRLKTVKDGVGGFFAWPKNQVVLDEENVGKSLFGTLLNVPGKTKDGVNARLDLEKLGIKPELFARQEEDKTTLPSAGYTLTNTEKTSFMKRYATSRKEISLQELDKMQVELVVTLYLLQKFFPLSFFDIMIHLTVHPTREDGKPLLAGKSSEVSKEVFQKAHMLYKQVLKTKNLGKRIALLENEHSKSFAKWLREEVERELAISKDSVSETVRWISYGPRATIVKYEAYNINGTYLSFCFATNTLVKDFNLSINCLRHVGIKSLLDAVRVTAAHICVNAAQLELVLLVNFNKKYAKS
nr:hypothetical protein [Tanacetum cinerariifolium]